MYVVSEPRQVLDFSFQRPSAQQVMDTPGLVGAISYLSRSPEKNWTAPEVAAYHAFGLWVGSVWETTATRAEDGYDAGGADAAAALTESDAFGYPHTATTWFAVDENVPFARVAAYFDGVRDARAGLAAWSGYGNQELVDAIAAMGAAPGWQVGTWGDAVSPNAGVVQLPNSRSPIPGTDLDLITRADCGLWMPDYVQEDDMPIPPEVLDAAVSAGAELHYLCAPCGVAGDDAYSGAKRIGQWLDKLIEAAGIPRPSA